MRLAAPFTTHNNLSSVGLRAMRASVEIATSLNIPQHGKKEK
jgi:hypothetical protein